MRVIFLEDDHIEDVAEGYARNYLIPRKLAVVATPQAIVAAEKRKEAKKAELEKKRAEMQALAEKLSSLQVVIEAEAGEEGKLFGSVTPSDIAVACQKISGIEIDKRKIELSDPIKVVGEYQVPVKLFSDIVASLKVKVVAK
ncbi:MAG: 50S ribosomal protein L9 [Candidatus Margulisiibacteriota bacterium]